MRYEGGRDNANAMRPTPQRVCAFAWREGTGFARYEAQHTTHPPVVRKEELEEGTRCTLGCLRSRDIVWHTICPLLLSGFTLLLPEQCVCDSPSMRLTSRAVAGTDVRTEPHAPLRLPYSFPLSAAQRPTPHTPKPPRTRMGVHACALSFLIVALLVVCFRRTKRKGDKRERQQSGSFMCGVCVCSRVRGNRILQEGTRRPQCRT